MPWGLTRATSSEPCARGARFPMHAVPAPRPREIVANSMAPLTKARFLDFANATGMKSGLRASRHGEDDARGGHRPTHRLSRSVLRRLEVVFFPSPRGTNAHSGRLAQPHSRLSCLARNKVGARIRAEILCHGFATSSGIRWVRAGSVGTSAGTNYARGLQGVVGIMDFRPSSQCSIPMRFRFFSARWRLSPRFLPWRRPASTQMRSSA